MQENGIHQVFVDHLKKKMTPNFLINNLVIKYKLMNIFMSDYLLDSFVTVGIHYEFFFFSSLFLLVFE